MKTLLLNDTSDYHYGCKQVVSTFTFDDSIKTNNYASVDTINYSKYDRVILNGEGTMHHSSNIGYIFLNGLLKAQRAECQTELLNTVWQQMPKHDALQGCNRIVVREIYSHNELKEMHGIESEIRPDRSMIPNVPYKFYSPVEIYRGQYFNRERRNDYPEINIFKQDWDEVVNRLRHSELLLTGRHHEMYAAIKARCKFIVCKGNSWKNEGLLEQFGLTTDMNIEDVMSNKYKINFEELFDYCHEEKSL